MTLVAEATRTQEEMAPSEMTEGLTFEERTQMYEALQYSSSVTSWMERGRPLRDVECMEVGNAIRALRYHAAYQKVRNPLMARHGLSERELVSQALLTFAAPGDEPRGAAPKKR